MEEIAGIRRTSPTPTIHIARFAFWICAIPCVFLIFCHVQQMLIYIQNARTEICSVVFRSYKHIQFRSVLKQKKRVYPFVLLFQVFNRKKNIVIEMSSLLVVPLKQTVDVNIADALKNLFNNSYYGNNANAINYPVAISELNTLRNSAVSPSCIKYESLEVMYKYVKHVYFL